MSWLLLLVPDSAVGVLIILVALVLLVGLIRPRTAFGWIGMLLLMIVTGPIVEAVTEAVFEALPLWLTLMILGSVGLAIVTAVLTLLLGDHGAGHVMGTLFVGFLKLLWNIVAFPFRALVRLYRLQGLAAVGAVLLVVSASTACNNPRAAHGAARGAARAAARKLCGRNLAGRARF